MAEVQLVMDMRMREKTRIGIIELSQSVSHFIVLHVFRPVIADEGGWEASW